MLTDRATYFMHDFALRKQNLCGDPVSFAGETQFESQLVQSFNNVADFLPISSNVGPWLCSTSRILCVVFLHSLSHKITKSLLLLSIICPICLSRITARDRLPLAQFVQCRFCFYFLRPTQTFLLLTSL